MANLPEKIIKQRLRLQIQSLDSPSELPGDVFRHGPDIGVSPMTDLALNLHCSSLGMTPSPNLDSKRRLSLDSSSSDSTPSPNHTDSSSMSIESPAPMVRADSTPLSSITNKPNRTKLGFNSVSTCSRLTTLKTSLRDTSPSNKENIVPLSSPLFSPGKRMGKIAKSPSFPTKLASPGKEEMVVKRAKSFQPDGRRRSVKRPMFSVMEEDTNSRDSGYSSQNLDSSQDDLNNYKKARGDDDYDLGESLQQMLADCSPRKANLYSRCSLTALPGRRKELLPCQIPQRLKLRQRRNIMKRRLRR